MQSGSCSPQPVVSPSARRYPCRHHKHVFQLTAAERPAHREDDFRLKATPTTRPQSTNTKDLEGRFLGELDKVGFPASILPSGASAHEQLDSLIQELEASSPIPNPLHADGAAAHPLLFGTWKLVFASNGTVVTRTAGAQALVAASLVPGVGLRDIQQELSDSQGAIRTTNSVIFGLFLLGEWNATIYGTWLVESQDLALVSFEGYSVQLVGAFGWRPLQQEFLKVKIPLPEAARQRSAEFRTTYLSQQLRIARGSTGNVFAFVRQPPLS